LLRPTDLIMSLFHVYNIHCEHESKPGHKTWMHVNVDTLILVQHKYKQKAQYPQEQS
jgi:hypothetical protein